jgi:DNA helicase-2/ATP-dependent DNA helicase PcrA
VQEALDLYEASWLDEWYENRKRHDEYKAKGKAAVKAFHAGYAEHAPDVIDVEKDFTLVLGPHSIKGKIDRIDRLPDGSVEVIDYKTGESKEKLDADAKEQLHLYQVALEEKGLKVGKLTYLYVGNWTAMEVEPLEGEDRDAFIDKLTTRMDAITRSDFAPTPEPFVCRFCDFRMICDFRKL